MCCKGGRRNREHNVTNTNSAKSEDHNLNGILLMAVGIFIITLKDVSAKFLVADIHPIQIVSLSAWLMALVLFMWPMVRMDRTSMGIERYYTRYWRSHILRSVFSVASGVSFLFALKFFPLAHVTVIFFSAPIAMTALSAIFLKEKTGIIRWAAVFAGFVGVAIALNPDDSFIGGIVGRVNDGTEGMQWEILLPLTASLTYAIRAVLVRAMTGIETASQIIFHTRLGTAVLTTIPLIYYWEPMTWHTVSILVLVATLQLIAHILITKSTMTASLTIVGPLEYTALIWAALLGYVIWGEVPTINVWIGALFIISAGVVVAVREARAKHPV